jgi:hypothetical protein
MGMATSATSGTEQQFGAILEHLASASYQGLDRDDSFESAA